MPKKKTGRAVEQVKTNAPALPERLAIGHTEIRPEQLYRNPERHPRAQGPWSGEPDKLAWRDAATNIDCIILRQADGTLSGYASVDSGHPLWGFNYDSVPSEVGTAAHRGLDYSELCSSRGPEEIRVCHVRPRAADRRLPQHVSDDKWWFGFDTSKPGDLVPKGGKPPLHREEGETYRNLNYVFEQTVALAGQLKSLQDSSLVSSGTPLQLGSPKPTPDEA